jgi:hypothetical protein
LLEALLTGRAFAAGIDDAAYADFVVDFEFDDLGADFGNAADDFMSGNAGVGGEAPFIAREVEIRVADAAKEDFNSDVLFSDVPTIEGVGAQRFGGALSGKACADEHESSPLGVFEPN